MTRSQLTPSMEWSDNRQKDLLVITRLSCAKLKVVGNIRELLSRTIYVHKSSHG